MVMSNKEMYVEFGAIEFKYPIDLADCKRICKENPTELASRRQRIVSNSCTDRNLNSNNSYTVQDYSLSL